MAAEELARQFNEREIRYAVVNGLYAYPGRIGRDLDILMRSADVPSAVLLAEQLQRKLSWNHLIIRYSYYGVWQFFFIRKAQDQLTWLEIDLMTDGRLIVGVAPLLPDFTRLIQQAREFRGPFRVSAEGEYAKAQLRPILYGDINRFEQKYPLVIPTDEALLSRLKELMGNHLLDQYIAFVNKGVEGIRSQTSHLKWGMTLRYAFRDPLRAFRNALWTQLLRPAMLYLFDSGLVFAVVGPDGVGKSSAVREAVRYFNGCFDVRVRHWRPGLLPSPRSLVPRRFRGNDTLPNRTRPGFLGHWLRVLYYYIDYTLGYFLKDRFLPRSVIQFVIYDRCALDMTVDPLRYKLSSPKGTGLLYRLTPRPDCIILLHDTPERIHQRKPELSLEEIRAQQQAWQRHVEAGNVDRVLAVQSTPEETGREVASAILAVVAHRFDVKRSAPWRLTTQQGRFSNVVVNGVCRVSYPEHANQPSRKMALRLYEPTRAAARLVYRWWSRFPVNIGRLRIESSEVPLGFSESEWRLWLSCGALGGNGSPSEASFYFPPQQDRRKAVILLPGSRGQPERVVKVAFDDASQSALAHETQALDLVGRLRVRTFQAPTCLSQGGIPGMTFAVYDYQADTHPSAGKWNSLFENAWSELRAKTLRRKKLSDWTWWNSLPEEIRKRFSDVVEAGEPTAGYACCWAHGDFAPWNLRLKQGTLILMDWEDFSPEAPILADPVHFFMSLAFLNSRRTAASTEELLCFVESLHVPVSTSDIILPLIYTSNARRGWHRRALIMADSLLRVAAQRPSH
jgi:hypothetical protein